MWFVLEEASWAWDGTATADFVERIELFLDRLDVARDRDEKYATSSDFWRRRVYGDDTLGDLFWGGDSPLQLPREVSERVAATLGSLEYWDDEGDWPGIVARIGGACVESPSAAFAHSRPEADPVACIPLPGAWQGPTTVEVDEGPRDVHFVVDEQTHRSFFRDVFAEAGADATRLVRLAPHAFPDTCFIDGIWQGLRKLDGGYVRVRDRLLRFLAVLDDHGAWAFTDDTGRLSPDQPVVSAAGKVPITNQLIQKRFVGLGLEVAPEKPDVKADEKCRQARERELEGRTLYCEWHYKFDPHINRAHIHGPVEESEGKVVFAILCDHLPLP